ncbi:UNVERIFIED_CONTAM: hypothetical protein FKN15_004846 [Acipenser sinensis]
MALCSTGQFGIVQAFQLTTQCIPRNHPDILGEFADQSGQTLDPKKWESTDPRQVNLTNKIVSFIANDLMPLSVIDSTAFHDILSTAEPCFTMPNRKHLSQKQLPQRTSGVQDQLSQMQQAHDIYLTIDLWSSRYLRYFIGIKGHFVVDDTLKTYVCLSAF